MSSHESKYKKEKVQSELFSLDDALKTINIEEYHSLVQNLIKNNPEVYRLVLEWFKEKSETSQVVDEEVIPLNDELLMEYWGNAEIVISEFNDYGGGPGDDENNAYHWLDEISELIEEANISSKVKYAFLDEAFIEYDKHNSGFEDSLVDIFFQICQTKEEWEYLVEKLAKHPSDWRNKLIMNIHKNYLCDDRAYLELRLKKLHYGMDYRDLADFYVMKDDLQKALKTAEEGILKGEGRIIELFIFLFEYFAEESNTSEVERIVRIALKRKSDEKVMLDMLFEYYKNKGNYEKAQKALIKAFEFIRFGKYYPEYKKMKEFLNDDDWEQLESEIIEDIKEKNIHDYLQICMDKNMKETVIHTILNPPENKQRWSWRITDNYDEFAERLEENFPEKVIDYYWQKAHSNIHNGKRKTYRIASKYLAKAKHIYIKRLKDVSKWKNRFTNLKVKFKNRPAFLDEVKKL